MTKQSPLSVVYEILNEYQELAGSIEELPISVDVLKRIVQKRCELKTLAWFDVPVETKKVLGYVKFYYPVPANIRTNEAPTTAIVRVKESLNFCWRRFVICKELCHCLIDTDDDRVSSTEVLKELVESLAADASVDLLNDGPLQSEKWAEILALEILYPYELRRGHRDALRSGTITPYDLALRFRIPLEYAELGMYEAHLKAVEQLRAGQLISVGQRK